MYFLFQHWGLLDLGHSRGHSGHSHASVSAPVLVSVTFITITLTTMTGTSTPPPLPFWVFFFFACLVFERQGPHYVALDGLELKPPTQRSTSAGIKSLCHHTWWPLLLWSSSPAGPGAQPQL